MIAFSHQRLRYAAPISRLRAVNSHRLAHNTGSTTTAAALATMVKVINPGRTGRLQISGENRHQAATHLMAHNDAPKPNSLVLASPTPLTTYEPWKWPKNSATTSPGPSERTCGQNPRGGSGCARSFMMLRYVETRCG